MTKNEAIRKLGDRLAKDAELVISMCDAIEAVRASPVASAFICNQASKKLLSFTPSSVAAMLTTLASLRDLEGI